ncbi:MAG: preprotein translocase subunit SecG [Candidatus Omnitrophica bacterium]|nr:preprotein translocase subunit SecG [Candidatus Omnitrophota bacterium]
MYILLILLHVLVCIVLIAVILLQAGRGGGLTEAFGGGETAQQLLGTQAPVVLKRATEVAAVGFLVTSLLLGIVTARRGRSLFERVQFPVAPGTSPQTQQGSPMIPATVPEQPQPGEETLPPAEDVPPVTEAE